MEVTMHNIRHLPESFKSKLHPEIIAAINATIKIIDKMPNDKRGLQQIAETVDMLNSNIQKYLLHISALEHREPAKPITEQVRTVRTDNHEPANPITEQVRTLPPDNREPANPITEQVRTLPPDNRERANPPTEQVRTKQIVSRIEKLLQKPTVELDERKNQVKAETIVAQIIETNEEGELPHSIREEALLVSLIIQQRNGILPYRTNLEICDLCGCKKTKFQKYASILRALNLFPDDWADRID